MVVVVVVVVVGLTILPPLTQLYRGNINLSAKKCESVSYCRPTQLYLNKPERKIIFGIQNLVIKYEKYFLTLQTSFLSLYFSIRQTWPRLVEKQRDKTSV